MIVMQQLENHILVPNIMRSRDQHFAAGVDSRIARWGCDRRTDRRSRGDPGCGRLHRVDAWTWLRAGDPSQNGRNAFGELLVLSKQSMMVSQGT